MNTPSELAQLGLSRFGLMLVGLDDIRAVTEAMGRRQALQLAEVARRRLKRRLRRGHLLELPRAGCFTAVLPNPKGADAMALLASRVLEDLRQPVRLGGGLAQPTASAGICLFPEDGDSLSDLLRRADLALERARRGGGDRFEFYDRTLNRRLKDHWDVSARLWRALKREEFSLAYQPLFSARTGELTGAEALLRWTDPVNGPQSPRDFVPLLEHSSLIVPVGEWVLRTACQQAAGWLREGLGRRTIAVNLSPRQFEHSDLLHRIETILVSSGLPPELLLLEITENQIMRNPAQGRLAVEALHAMGVRVLIDDFGTGYSSITSLRALRVHGLKIDRSFVMGLPHERSDVLLVETIVALARGLGLEVVAEGVETEEQAAFLRGRDVHGLQGYLLGRPMPPDQFAQLLREPELRSRAKRVALTAPRPTLQ